MGVFLLATLAFRRAVCSSRAEVARLPGLRHLAAHGRIGPLLRRIFEALAYFGTTPASAGADAALHRQPAPAGRRHGRLGRALEMPLAFADLLVVFPIITVWPPCR
jgi:hypothetical protein